MVDSAAGSVLDSLLIRIPGSAVVDAGTALVNFTNALGSFINGVLSGSPVNSNVTPQVKTLAAAQVTTVPKTITETVTVTTSTSLVTPAVTPKDPPKVTPTRTTANVIPSSFKVVLNKGIPLPVGAGHHGKP